MMVMATAIIISLTVLLSVFVNFAPNLNQIIQSDFLRRAYYNTSLYGMQRAQLAIRSGRMTTNPGEEKIFVDGSAADDEGGIYIQKTGDNVKSRFSTEVTYKSDPIDIEVITTYQPQ